MSVMMQPVTQEGARRAARVLRALGDHAAPVWAQLTETETRLITDTMNGLSTDDLRSDSDAMEAFLRESAAFTEHSERLAEAGDPLAARLERAEPALLAVIAARESPQIGAFIVAHLPPRRAAGLVRMLERDSAIAILDRLTDYSPPSAEITEIVGQSLGAILERLEAGASENGTERLARIFDQLDTRSEAGLLGALEAKVPGTGEKVRARMFTFADILRLDPAGIQTLLGSTDRADLALALKGAKETVSSLFFANMTTRASTLLREEIEVSGPVRRAEIEAARARLAETARELIRRGEIVIAGAGRDDELIE